MIRILAIVTVVVAFFLTASVAPAQDRPILTRGELYDIYPVAPNAIPYANVRRVQVISHLGGSWYNVVAIYLKDGVPDGESPRFYLNIDALTSIFPIPDPTRTGADAAPSPSPAN